MTADGAIDKDVLDAALTDVIALVTECRDNTRDSSAMLAALRLLAMRDGETTRPYIRRMAHTLVAFSSVTAVLLDQLGKETQSDAETWLRAIALGHATRTGGTQ